MGSGCGAVSSTCDRDFFSHFGFGVRPSLQSLINQFVCGVESDNLGANGAGRSGKIGSCGSVLSDTGKHHAQGNACVLCMMLACYPAFCPGLSFSDIGVTDWMTAIWQQVWPLRMHVDAAGGQEPCLWRCRTGQQVTDNQQGLGSTHHAS